MQRLWVPSLVWEVRSHVLCGTTKKWKKKKKGVPDLKEMEAHYREVSGVQDIETTSWRWLAEGNMISRSLVWGQKVWVLKYRRGWSLHTEKLKRWRSAQSIKKCQQKFPKWSLATLVDLVKQRRDSKQTDWVEGYILDGRTRLTS